MAYVSKMLKSPKVLVLLSHISTRLFSYIVDVMCIKMHYSKSSI